MLGAREKHRADWRFCATSRQSGSYPEKGFEEIGLERHSAAPLFRADLGPRNAKRPRRGSYPNGDQCSKITGLPNERSSASSICTPAVASPSCGVMSTTNRTGRHHVVKRCSIDLGLATNTAVDPVPVLILKCGQPVLLEHVFQCERNFGFSRSRFGKTDEYIPSTARVLCQHA